MAWPVDYVVSTPWCCLVRCAYTSVNRAQEGLVGSLEEVLHGRPTLVGADQVSPAF